MLNALASSFDDIVVRGSFINASSSKESFLRNSPRRGFNIVQLNVTDCSISNFSTFDTFGSANNSINLAMYISSQPLYTVLAGVTFDEAYSRLEANGRAALLAIGVDTTDLRARSKLIFVAQVGRPLASVWKIAPSGGDNLVLTVTVQGEYKTRVITNLS